MAKTQEQIGTKEYNSLYATYINSHLDIKSQFELHAYRIIDPSLFIRKSYEIMKASVLFYEKITENGKRDISFAASPASQEDEGRETSS